ncbi:MAG: DHA2 family efflux MFS transporter permease subunit, partial [Streptosporangiaceae bacterium]
PLCGWLALHYGRKRLFLVSIAGFTLASALCGLADNITQMVLYRLLQGVFGAALIPLSQAVLLDINPREKHAQAMAIWGAGIMLGPILGPTLGGYLTDEYNWRWVFYINVPIGIVALIVVAAVLPGSLRRTKHTIDYVGTALLAAAATCLVLLTSLGGTTFAWSSGPIIGLGVGALAAIAGFVLVERRAAEPVLPLSLFRNRVFSAASAVGLVVGFAMFGALAYLPQYFQIVKGVSPTSSGLRLLPLMAGLLATSITTGQLVSRWGRYKVFPVVGTAVLTLGLYLLSRLSVTTGTLLSSLYMLVLGAGIGGSMQVLVLAVQNSVPYAELGTATAGTTFFRSIGGSFGTAVFGAVFTNVLPHNLARELHGLALPPGLTAATGASPAVLDRLPQPVHEAFVHAYAASLHTVFLTAVPLGALAFVLSWTLQEVPLRATTRSPDPADTLAPTARPSVRDTSQEMERAITSLLSRERRRVVYGELISAAGLQLKPRAGWLLLRVGEHPVLSRQELAGQLQLRDTDLQHRLAELTRPGYVADGDAGQPVRLTTTGRAAYQGLLQAREDQLRKLCADWHPDRHPQLQALLTTITHQLAASGEKPGADLDAA